MNIKISDAAHKPTGGNKFSREKLYATWDSGVNKRKKIVAIGINPSTAKDNKSDMTVTRLCRFLDMYGFNNVEIINLFEDVSINQSGINKTTKVDFNTKRDLLDEADVILLVWGIKGYKEYKKEVKVVLLDYVDKLYCIKNQNGNYPVHPSRMPYESEIIPITDAVNFEKCGL